MALTSGTMARPDQNTTALRKMPVGLLLCQAGISNHVHRAELQGDPTLELLLAQVFVRSLSPNDSGFCLIFLPHPPNMDSASSL